MLGLFGFAVGYVLGARAGRERLEEVARSWRAVSESDEFKAAVANTREVLSSALRQLLSEGAGAIGNEVRGALDRRVRKAA